MLKKMLKISLTFNDPKKTLSDDEINEVFNKIIEIVQNKCGAELRK